MHRDGVSLLGEVLAVTFSSRGEHINDRSVNQPGYRESRRNGPNIPGAIRSTVTPMLIADVVKVRLEIERRIGAVLDSIELLS